jgi:MFS family permease
VQYADVVIAVLAALALAWIADLLTGRRGLVATSLVSATGAICGWFLAIRVFAVVTMDQWSWVGWSIAGSVFCLVAYFLFRNKR